MEIRAVNASEAKEVLKIYHSCVCQHQEKGFNQWDADYPNLQTIHKDLQNRWLFGAYVEGGLVAVISITEDEPVEYRAVTWENESYYIIHRLCVSEQWLRKGIAKELMGFAEGYALQKEKKSIRLDTYSLNKGALLFYKKLGYRQAGFVNFSKKTEANYTCFEKQL